MRKILISVMVLLFALPIIAYADYPTRPITIIIPSKAGGSTDTTARLFSVAAKKYWKGADFVIKNVGGSGGQKGFEEIARAEPDGYTIGMVFTTQVVAHIVSKRAKYTLDSFHIMGNVCHDPEIVVVPPKSPYTSLDELAKGAKGKTLIAAVNGIGSDDHVAMLKFENHAGVKFNMMPTKGSTEQKAAVMGGHVDVAFMNVSQMYAQQRAGDARIIALLDDNRTDLLPDVKTAKEQGYPVSMNMTATRGFVAPARVDKQILKKLDDLLMKVLKDEEFLANCKKSALLLLPMTGKEYRSYLDGEAAETKKFYDKNPW
ncbi:MAG: tripartite tricarboxylate transporter substrate binding protein [bacterium]|nr:tripartite tricarboxylate transporter substrate binding protein [bacterium]